MRYDACIIGGGADGLAAAAVLAGRGLKVVVAERDSRPGGRCTTREFHPGFRASPYADELPAIPDAIFRALDLARRGAVLMPAACGPAGADGVRDAVVARVMADAETPPPRRRLFAQPPPSRPWPGEELAARTMHDTLGDAAADASGGVCDAALAGSALWTLAGPPGGMAAGGLGRLGEALRTAAVEAGAEISCGLEVTDVRRKNGRLIGVGLGDGSEIAARAIVSTLDLKRTFLSLFAWNELPRPVVERVGAFRPAAGTARLLVALKSPPEGAPRHPLRLASDPPDEAYHAWRNAAVPARPPAVARVVSVVDPFLAPEGAATMTVTLAAIPFAPFDGPWTKDKRDRLRDAALAAVEAALPGTAERVLSAELLVPPDIENLLGVTEGDLMGGDLLAAQMLGFRPFPECGGTRTPVEGLYLAGPSSALGPLATCASGVAAARAVAADLAAGRLK